MWWQDTNVAVENVYWTGKIGLWYSSSTGRNKKAQGICCGERGQQIVWDSFNWKLNPVSFIIYFFLKLWNEKEKVSMKHGASSLLKNITKALIQFPLKPRKTCLYSFNFQLFEAETHSFICPCNAQCNRSPVSAGVSKYYCNKIN